jgi:hypothetical protein
MGMNMKDGLPGIGIGVEDHPIPTLEDALELGNLTSGSNNLTKQLRIPSSKLPKVPIPLPRHNKHVNPSLRPNIPEGKGGLILKNNVSRDLPPNDPFKEILTHEQTLSTPKRTRVPSHPTRAPSGTTRVPGWTTRVLGWTTRGEKAEGRRAKQDAF